MCGGAAKRLVLIEYKMFRSHVALDWGLRQTAAMLVELLALFRVVKARERIGKIILRSGNPLGGKSETTGDLLCCHPAGHPEPKVFAGSSVAK